MSDLQSSTSRPVKLFGYSERGMVNAICDDVTYADDPIATFESLLSLISFPFAQPNFCSVSMATFIVEQSFSDFGDLDLLILLDHLDGRKQAVLIEAKVHTDTSTPKTIEKRWREFGEYLQGDKKKTSNVFVQLYRKLRLIRQMDDLNRTLPVDGVAQRWSLGNNQVVRRAAETLRPYRAEPWYVCLLPDSAKRIETFFTDKLAAFQPNVAQLPDWNTERMGFVTWEQIESLASSDSSAWKRTLPNFEWNTGQIYRKTDGPPPPPGETVQQGKVYRRNDEDVLVVVSRQNQDNCRVVPLQTTSRYFPESMKVAKASLGPSDLSSDSDDLQPSLQGIYQWQPPEGARYQPKGRPQVPTPSRRIRVLTRGWETSEVSEVDKNEMTVGDSFYVFTHHILRR